MATCGRTEMTHYDEYNSIQVDSDRGTYQYTLASRAINTNTYKTKPWYLEFESAVHN